MIKASDLTQKEVISITDGRKIGFISDLEVDLEKGKINAIVIPTVGKFMSVFSKEEEYEFTWKQIKKIGIDVILVDTRGISDSEQIKYENITG